MEALEVDNSAGAVDVSLIGRWGRDVTGTIKNSAGNIRVRLPSDVGVCITASTSAGRVTETGMESRSGDVYVNDSYRKSPVTIKLTVKNSAGNIDIEVE